MFECPECKGKISRHHTELRACQDCKKIINLSNLLKLPKNIGVTEQNIKRILDKLSYPVLFAAQLIQSLRSRRY